MPGSGDLVERAVAAVTAGKLVVVPTDTVYGIGTRADLGSATARIFEAKTRGRDVPIPVLVGSWDQARAVGRFTVSARAIARLVWPGAVTLIVPRARETRGWELGGDGSSVGLRIPAHPVTGEILGRTGPLAVSSANRTGDVPSASCAEIRGIFGGSVAVYVCDDRMQDRAASTVVDLTGNEPRVIRRGDANPDDLARWSEAWRAAM